MKFGTLPSGNQRKIHTPAIFDSAAKRSETRAVAGFARSTGQHEAVHIRGPWACQYSGYAASHLRSRQ